MVHRKYRRAYYTPLVVRMGEKHTDWYLLAAYDIIAAVSQPRAQRREGSYWHCRMGNIE